MNQNTLISSGQSSFQTSTNNLQSIWAADEGTLSNHHQSQTIASQSTPALPKLSTAQSNATPSSTPSSSSYHTTSSQLSSSSTTTANQSTTTSLVPITTLTLESIISSRSQYLTGPSSIYTAWLQTELDIETPSDLQEAIEDCPEMLEVGNGVVGIKRGLMGAFCRAVQAAQQQASSSDVTGIVVDGNGRKHPPLPVKKTEEGDDAIAMGTVNAAVLQEEEEKAAKQQQPQQWICPSCNVQFCKQFPKCPVCGANPPVDQVMRVERERMARQAQLEQEREYEKAKNRMLDLERTFAADLERAFTAGEVAKSENAKRQAETEPEQERAWEEHKCMLARQAEAERARMAHQAQLDAEKADRENERKREELRAKDRAREEQKRLAKEARLAKAADKARQEELEREDAEEERRRLEQAKKEKMAALERHGTTVSVKALSVSSLSSGTPSFQPKMPKGVASIGSSSSNQSAKHVAAGMKASQNSSSKSITISSTKLVTKAQRKPAFVRKTNRLSYYIKNDLDSGDNISPIFSLLQNEKTLKRGMKLLLLECQAKEQRSLIDELIKKRASDEAMLNKITLEE